jgi:hypothetical protein
MLDLSTMHLPEQLGDDSHPGLPAVDGVVAYRLPYGFLMWVPDDPVQHAADYGDRDVEGGVPPEILRIQIYALARSALQLVSRGFGHATSIASAGQRMRRYARPWLVLQAEHGAARRSRARLVGDQRGPDRPAVPPGLASRC